MSTADQGHWRIERDSDQILWLWADKADASANVLSSEVLRELDEHLTRIRAEAPRGLVVLSAKKSGFIAGADIKEFTRIQGEDSGYRLIHAGQAVLDRLAALPFPTLAALHGFALGGGLELALACRYRIAVGDEHLTLGLPEVQLGIHPGFGGTVRSVQLIGVKAAMRLMLTGKPVRAEEALRLGLVDRLVSAEALRDEARRLILHPRPQRRAPLRERMLSWAPLRPWVVSSLTAQVASKVRREHYPAPYAIIDLWSRYGAHGPAAFEAEARSIARLFVSETARGLIRVFLLQDRLKALAGKRSAPLEQVHVIGAGVMGGDIAAWVALRGCRVSLHDSDAARIEPALGRARELFEKRLRSEDQVAAAVQRLSADLEGRTLGEADVVIEAIVEDLEAKRTLLQRIEPHLKPEALLATNTSSIDIGALGTGLQRPERLVGLHFFNPVAQMPLVEIVSGPKSGEAMLRTATAFARTLDKLPLPCRSAPGFVVNRILMPYLQEAMYAAAEGVPLEVIDATAVAFGMPIGPVELADVVGLDVAAHVGAIVAQGLGRPVPDLAPLRERIAAGQLGRKSGTGFYPWRDGKALKAPATGAAPEDLCDRLILILLNECVACLRERIAADADLIDAAVVFGTGFAPFRGGPIAYARARGVSAVVERLQGLAQRHGERFEPDAGWALLASGAGEP
ncbi:MAG: 3-hydroxyacyl-CoA dehydrogenase NAD-binding domain-containing protein [Steroidobacteraceae bacterium]